MACPDPRELEQLSSSAASPEIIAHLEECAPCRLDWQIMHGARYALHPPEEVPPWLNERVMVQIKERVRLRELRRSRLEAWEPAITGGLLAAATFANLVLGPAGAGAAMFPAFLCALAGGALGVLYLRWQDSVEIDGT